MEEAKAAAYYDELTRKGGGAARFKQGLGFSSTTAVAPSRGSALPSSSSSFLSNFVRASSPSALEKQAQLETIQTKLKKKPNPSENQNQSSSRVSSDRTKDRDIDRDRHSSHRSRSRDRDRDRHSRRRSRSRSRDGHHSRHRHRSSSRDRDRYRDREKERDRDRDRDRGRRRRKSRSRSVSDEGRGRRRGRGRSRSRSASPRDRTWEKSRGDGGKIGKERNGAIDYAKLIDGYDQMSPAEKVKAKTKLQLSETAEKDATKGMGSGWERFDFDKDAPLDDEEIEVAEDDAVLVKHIGQSFRFSAVEARREDEIKAAHDKAMFGASSVPPSVETDDEIEGDNKKESTESAPVKSLISDKVLAMQQGSWRDRARKV